MNRQIEQPKQLRISADTPVQMETWDGHRWCEVPLSRMSGKAAVLWTRRGLAVGYEAPAPVFGYVMWSLCVLAIFLAGARKYGHLVGLHVHDAKTLSRRSNGRRKA